MLRQKIKEYDKKSWAMKIYAAYRWGQDMPCPFRFVVNTYISCAYQCAYCYVWQNRDAQIKKGLRVSLLHDIARAKQMGLNFPVFVSSSTDPFQPKEKKYGESLFVIRQLLENGFTVIIMTKNPDRLLQDEYLPLTLDPNLHIDVTVSSLQENDSASIFHGFFPLLKHKLNAIERLIQAGKVVRVKVDPIIPSVCGIQGQSSQELKQLVGKLKQVGISTIISKTLRINQDVSSYLLNRLEGYYQANGVQEGVNLALPKPIREELLRPLLEACQHHEIDFCPCVETGIFPDDHVVSCHLSGEKEEL